MAARHNSQRRPPEAPPAIVEAHVALAEVKTALARARPVCTVYARSYSAHVLQIYAGLYALHETGHIRVRQRFGPEHLRRRLAGTALDDRMLSRTLNGLFVDVDGAGLVFFDVRDGANFFQEVVGQVAVYAKRSFRGSAYGPNREKFVPLGLNYSVYPDRTTRLELMKSFAQLGVSRLAARHLLFSLARIFPPLAASLGVPTVGSFMPAVDAAVSPKAIFLARAWSPSETSEPAEALKALNDLRAECIRVMRRRFGERFLGGFARSPYALAHYADCVVAPGLSTHRRDYLQCLRAYAICIATTGLHESIGWKFAEYVALSKAIVSEPLRFELPGPIAAGENYLEFATPEACAERVAELFEDRDLRLRMMAGNARYYSEFGTPDAVVGRVLEATVRRRA